MPASKNGDKPIAPKFNFDTYTHEVDGDFDVVIGGKRYVAQDPVMLDFRELFRVLRTGDPVKMFEKLFPDAHEEILANKTIPVGAMVKFNEAVEAHFGLQDFLESAPSSNATATL